jgi:hypothetical protein
VAKPAAKHNPNAKISPEEALRLLDKPPVKAAGAITKAVHDNDCRIYCNGSTVAAHILPDIRLAAVLENDGRWTAVVQSISNQWPGHIFRWELIRTEVEALRTAPQMDATLWLPLEFEKAPRRPGEHVGEYVDRMLQRLLDDPGVKDCGRGHVWNVYNAWRKGANNG